MIDPFALHYSDNNRKKEFCNGGSNGHGLQNATCKQTLTDIF